MAAESKRGGGGLLEVLSVGAKKVLGASERQKMWPRPIKVHCGGYFIQLSLGPVICLLGVLLYTVTFFLLQVRLYEGFQMGYSDLVYEAQALYNTLHGRFFQIMPIEKGDNLFASHFRPVMLLILPLYALLPDVYTLFFLQALAGGVGAFAVFLLAKDILRSEFAATCFSLAYLFYPSLQWANLNMLIWGFHVENLFPPALLFAFYFLKKSRYRLSAISFLLALMNMEYYAILLACLSLFIFFSDRRNRKVAATAFCLSTLWFLVATWWIIPCFRSGNSPWYFEATGGIGYLLQHLLPLLSQVVKPLPAYLFVLLAPVLFLPLASFPIFATVLPNLLVNLLAPTGGYHIPVSPVSWHTSPLIPMVFISAILGLNNLLHIVEKWFSREKLLQASSFALLLVMIFLDYWWGPFPFSSAVHPDRYVLKENLAKGVQEIKAMIPQDASLCATSKISSHFSQRQTLHNFDDHWETADYILIGFDPAKHPTGRALQNSGDHELIYSSHGVYLFRNRFAKPVIQHPLQANLGGVVQMVGYATSADRINAGDELKLTLHWQALEEMKTSYTVFTHLVDESGEIWGQKDNLPVDGTYLTTEWRVGEIVIDRYEIEVDPTTMPGEYTLEVGMYEWTLGERLPVLNEEGQVEDNRLLLGTVWVEEP
jgi:uncharacterized membrane protein